MGKRLLIIFFLLICSGCKNNKSSTTNLTNTTTTTYINNKDSPLMSVSGFAQDFISNRIDISSDSDCYVIVNNEYEFIEALSNKEIKVIEINNDLNLGYEELQWQYDLSEFSKIVKSHNKPLLHPTLIESGVSKINIQDRHSLMIFSKSGHTIKHASFIIKRSEDIVFRNLRFDEIWEFDEATKGDYDRNDWDYFTLEDSNGVWLDHLVFGKAYDGLIDLKEGSKNVTISFSSFIFEPNDFIYEQFAFLEENINNYPLYQFLRNSGMTIDEIVTLYSSQKKGHLVGASELDERNKELSLTLHHNIYRNLQDRLPRLRAGNVHIYNVILDNSYLYKVKNDLSRRYRHVFDNSQFKIGVNNQGIITTENGACLMENSVFIDVSTPIKNNQKNKELIYTGKYRVINSIYQLNDYTFRGGSEDSNTPFRAYQVEPLEFNWNGFTELYYHYQLADVITLTDNLKEEKVGLISDEKINWLKIKEVEE